MILQFDDEPIPKKKKMVANINTEDGMVSLKIIFIDNDNLTTLITMKGNPPTLLSWTNITGSIHVNVCFLHFTKAYVLDKR